MLRFLFIGLLVYFLYKFIFEFLLPVAKATRDMKSKINQFQQQAGQPPFGEKANPQPEPRPKAGDYIDYEEVK